MIRRVGTHVLIKADLFKVYSVRPLGVVEDIIGADIESAGNDVWTGLPLVLFDLPICSVLTSDILSLQKQEHIMYHLPLWYRKVGAQRPAELSTDRMSTPWERRLMACPIS
jgi:hypothetical protein